MHVGIALVPAKSAVGWREPCAAQRVYPFVGALPCKAYAVANLVVRCVGKTYCLVVNIYKVLRHGGAVGIFHIALAFDEQERHSVYAFLSYYGLVSAHSAQNHAAVGNVQTL